ncbi:MAG TPA: proline--tRNA ligase, partial [Croceibacterium sp.]
GKPAFDAPAREHLVQNVGNLLGDIQQRLLAEARERRDANIVRDITSFDELAAFFGEDKRYPGWVEVSWSRPGGAALEQVVERLKALKLTFRNVPLDAEPAHGACLFTGEPAVERIYVARAY